jgi:hypothetical protein
MKGTLTMNEFDLNNLSPEMKADLDAYYDWLEEATGEQELPEDFSLQNVEFFDGEGLPHCFDPPGWRPLEDHMGRSY